jgi:hypothetical protein
MSYVDAGYAIALGALFVYAISLVLRRRRWERAASLSSGTRANAGGPKSLPGPQSAAEPVTPGPRQ